MIKLIQMNFYRMIHSKFTYIILMSMMAMIVFVGVVSKYTVIHTGESSEEGVVITDEDSDVSADAEDDNIGITVNPVGEEEDSVIMDYAVGDLQSGLLLVFVVIFVSMFVNAEESSGFIKNIARQARNKRSIVLAKLPVIISYSAAVIVVYMAFQIIVEKILYPSYPLGLTADVFAYAGIQLLLMSGIASLVACLTTVTKSTAMGITIGILIAMGFTSLLTSGIEIVIDNAIDVDKYTLMGNISMLPFDIVSEDYLRAGIAAAAWFIIWTVLSVFVSEKRDTV